MPSTDCVILVLALPKWIAQLASLLAFFRVSRGAKDGARPVFMGGNTSAQHGEILAPRHGGDWRE